MHKSEKPITTKMNVTHKPLDENTIYLDQIVDRLSSYILLIFSNFLQGNFHLSEKLMSLENHHQKPSNPKLTTSNDHNF
jgi:hypothetical protein